LLLHDIRAAASRTFLDGRQEQSDEDRDDGDHHQQLNQRKSRLYGPDGSS